VGELWIGDDVVLAHEFRFQPVSDTGVFAGADASRADGRGRARAATPRSAVRIADGSVGGVAPRDGDSACGASDTHSARSTLDKERCLTPGLLVSRFAAFFAGEDAGFDDVSIDLGWATPFQHAVATAVRVVRRGEVVSYGELAALAGYPGAARAAGTFCAHNRFMLILPCHRVVGATGIGGYGSAGPETKRRLLALEGVVV
jgi:methylated-DNA-[protein]-cysteine S-methyltransferase